MLTIFFTTDLISGKDSQASLMKSFVLQKYTKI